MAGRRTQDELLSKAISPPARRPEDNEGLRSLLVTRLSPSPHKAVVRIALRGTRISAYCEGCRRWTGPLEEFPLEFDCACGLSYATETVIMEQVEDDLEDDDEDDVDLENLSFDFREVNGGEVPPRATDEEVQRLGFRGAPGGEGQSM